MSKGSQAWYCYGNRNNAFLMLNYGFCLKDNEVDSVKWYVKAEFEDKDFFADTGPTLDKMLLTSDLDLLNEEENSKQEEMQEIRFKRYQFNEVLMAYIRSSFRGTYPKVGKYHLINGKRLLITGVVNLQFEKKCLKRYEQIVLYIVKCLEEATSLEDDLEIINNNHNLSTLEYFAIIYRSEKKKTLWAQLELVQFM